MDPELHKFANILTVLSKPTDDPKQFLVYWRSGLNKQGKTNVRISAEVEDRRIVAELTAMQHIIDDLDVLGNEPPLKGVKFVFSASAIKKVHANKSEKRHLYPYAYFLTTRFAGAAVAVDQDDAWIKPRSESNLSEIDVTEPPGQTIYVNQVGKVAITRHVIEQFTKRMNNLDPDAAWKLLTRTLAQARLERLPDTDAGAELAKVKHASEGARLVDVLSKWCFVIATNKYGRPTIATAYLKM